MDDEKIRLIIENKLDEAYTLIMASCEYGDIDPLRENVLTESTDSIVSTMISVYKDNKNG